MSRSAMICRMLNRTLFSIGVHPRLSAAKHALGFFGSSLGAP